LQKYSGVLRRSFGSNPGLCQNIAVGYGSGLQIDR